MPAFTVSTSNDIAVLTLDVPGEPVNTLSAAVREEFAALLPKLRDDPAVRAIVLLSGKPDIFIAGADVEEFTRITTREGFDRLIREGQELIEQVAALSKPVVAAIHGACLGGGLELALACHWRVATDHPKTRLGLPEVQLGIIPAAGGCQRLPRLIGVRAALDLILAGRAERAAKAYRAGMVDELVAPPILRQVALAAAARLARDGVPSRPRRGGLPGTLLDHTAVGRRLVYRRAREQVMAKTGGHYPAPLAALDAVRTGMEDGMTAGLARERELFAELAVGSVSRKLVQIFFATTALKKDDGIPPGTAATPRRVRRVGVVGAGFMGAGIAGTAVLEADVEVRLKDADLARVGRGLGTATRLLDERLKRRRLSRPEHARKTALLSATADYSGFTRADLVIEAVFEDLDLKRRILAEVEHEIAPAAIFATNTSTIPIHAIAIDAARPERVLGMHFFSPVEKMPLLEVIPHDGTGPDAIVAAVRFGRAMGKTVIVVGDRPGFWVNRILTPYLNEAGRMVLEGVPIDLIDRTMTRFGFPVGPIALLDEVGLDVAQKAGVVMHQSFGDRLRPAETVARLMADDRLGRKNGRGFYLYRGGKKAGVDKSVYRLLDVKPLDHVDPALIERRLVYSMLNEAARAVEDEVVRTPRDGDIGALFGIGFPPFRGGPLRMIDDFGAETVVETLHGLVPSYGDRFEPAPGLVEMAKTRGTYYPGD